MSPQERDFTPRAHVPEASPNPPPPQPPQSFAVPSSAPGTTPAASKRPLPVPPPKSQNLRSTPIVPPQAQPQPQPQPQPHEHERAESGYAMPNIPGKAPGPVFGSRRGRGAVPSRMAAAAFEEAADVSYRASTGAQVPPPGASGSNQKSSPPPSPTKRQLPIIPSASRATPPATPVVDPSETDDSEVVSVAERMRRMGLQNLKGARQDAGLTQAATRPLPQVRAPATTPNPPVPSISLPGDNEDSSDEDVQNSVPAISVETPPKPTVPKISFPGDDSDSDDPDAGGISVSVAPPSPPPSNATSAPAIVSPPPQSSTTTVASLTRRGVPSTSLHCSGCNQLIAGRIVNALDQRWHPDCFTCEHCKQALEHVAFYEHEGRAYCGVDYDDLFSLKCHHCNTSINDEAFVTLDDPALSGGPRHYHQLHLFCAECGDPFVDPKSLEERSRISKDPHLRGEDDDDASKKEVTARPFVLHRGYPYCEKCHIRLHKPKCWGCKQPMVGDMVKAMGRQWHETCFGCKDCGRAFPNGAFFVDDGAPLCEDCYSVRLRREF